MSIYLIMPNGNRHGWGICGKYLLKALSSLVETRYVTQAFSLNDIEDELDFHFLRSKLVSQEEAAQLSQPPHGTVDHPVLQAIVNHSLEPWLLKIKGRPNVGYTFFETDMLKPEYIQNGQRNFDLIVAGSRWCETVLRNHGLTKVTTVIQGIDPQLFNPCHSGKTLFQDRFVIFSGGKFELRKGQDLVIRAVKVLQERHPDVMLINAWFNAWSQSLATMTSSPYITFKLDSNDYMQLIQTALQANGVDGNRVITLLPRPNAQMAKIYKNTDIGLFPNRCEGGTNLVLMEYMACGKPVIASNSSGHRDILTDRNAIVLKRLRPMNIHSAEGRYTWDDPDLEEIIEQLEWAYRNREQLKPIGAAAGADLSGHTWQKSGEAFYHLLNGAGNPNSQAGHPGRSIHGDYCQ